MENTTHNSDYVRQQKARKPGMKLVKIKVVKGMEPIWSRPHLLGAITKN